MTIHSEQERDAQLHQLVHDIQHCMYVIGVATELLDGVRDDDCQFAEICKSIHKERKQATKLVSQFLNAVCGVTD